MARINIELQSAALKSASYDPELEELDIRFNNGSLFTYEGVPQHIFEGLRDAGSPGSFYHQNIKNQYGNG